MFRRRNASTPQISLPRPTPENPWITQNPRFPSPAPPPLTLTVAPPLPLKVLTEVSHGAQCIAMFTHSTVASKDFSCRNINSRRTASLATDNWPALNILLWFLLDTPDQVHVNLLGPGSVCTSLLPFRLEFLFLALSLKILNLRNLLLIGFSGSPEWLQRMSLNPV